MKPYTVFYFINYNETSDNFDIFFASSIATAKYLRIYL